MSWILGLLGLQNKDKGSVLGDLFLKIREAIKGKEADPDTLIGYIHEVNKAEAQHRSIFVAGWRPAIGWVGAMTMAYHYIIQPLLIWVLTLNGIDEHPPTLDLDQLYPIITGMLGIAGMRSFDKMKGKS